MTNLEKIQAAITANFASFRAEDGVAGCVKIFNGKGKLAAIVTSSGEIQQKFDGAKNLFGALAVRVIKDALKS